MVARARVDGAESAAGPFQGGALGVDSTRRSEAELPKDRQGRASQPRSMVSASIVSVSASVAALASGLRPPPDVPRRVAFAQAVTDGLRLLGMPSGTRIGGRNAPPVTARACVNRALLRPIGHDRRPRS